MDRNTTRQRRIALCIWPGLPQLWWRGSPWALGIAVGFAVLLNFVIVASFAWTEWAGPQAVTAGWIVLAATWVAGVVFSWRRGDHREIDHAQSNRSSHDKTSTQDTEADDLFRQARDNYLSGNWYEAEETLVRLLQRSTNDVDARLMLATLMRHTGRYDDASGQLKQLQRLEAAGKWQLEIRREWEYLAREQQADDDSPANTQTEASETPGATPGGEEDEASNLPADVPHAA
ncbi:MAG: tetratricopeptide repeat protein [Planctomycetes bacterium]|nr:tetratricopeptide repeat protein [Planctomycetota bacterium]